MVSIRVMWRGIRQPVNTGVTQSGIRVSRIPEWIALHVVGPGLNRP